MNSREIRGSTARGAASLIPKESRQDAKPCTEMVGGLEVIADLEELHRLDSLTPLIMQVLPLCLRDQCYYDYCISVQSIRRNIGFRDTNL